MSGTLPRIAVVTGADSGIGRATALLLASEGFDIGLTVHEDEEGARRTAAEVEERGQRCATEQLRPKQSIGKINRIRSGRRTKPRKTTACTWTGSTRASKRLPGRMK